LSRARSQGGLLLWNVEYSKQVFRRGDHQVFWYYVCQILCDNDLTAATHECCLADYAHSHAPAPCSRASGPASGKGREAVQSHLSGTNVNATFQLQHVFIYPLPYTLDPLDFLSCACFCNISPNPLKLAPVNAGSRRCWFAGVVPTPLPQSFACKVVSESVCLDLCAFKV